MLAGIRQVKTIQVCDIPVYFGQVLCYIVSCHLVDNFLSELVLGMEQLTSFNPIIQWFDYEVDLVCNNSVVTLHGQQHWEQLLIVYLCKAKVASKAICQGATVLYLCCVIQILLLYMKQRQWAHRIPMRQCTAKLLIP